MLFVEVARKKTVQLTACARTINRLLKVYRVPKDDRSYNEIETRHAVALIFKRPIPHFAETEVSTRMIFSVWDHISRVEQTLS